MAYTSRPCSAAGARDERATGQAGLDHQHAQRQAADDAVAPWEVAGQWPGIQRILGNQRTAVVDHRLRKLLMALWIKFLQPRAEHGNRAPTSLQRSPMSGTVDAYRQPAGNGETCLRKVAGKCPGCVERRGCGTSAAHDGQLRRSSKAGSPATKSSGGASSISASKAG